VTRAPHTTNDHGATMATARAPPTVVRDAARTPPHHYTGRVGVGRRVVSRLLVKYRGLWPSLPSPSPSFVCRCRRGRCQMGQAIISMPYYQETRYDSELFLILTRSRLRPLSFVHQCTLLVCHAFCVDQCPPPTLPAADAAVRN